MIITQLNSISSVISYVLYLGLAVLVLMLMITIHELGHYVFGKLLNFKINEFSIGFGKAIFSKKIKSGELFSIRLIPLGGYCAFDGEDEEGNETSTSFNSQAPWKRIIVLFGGVLFNFLSAIIFAFILLVGFGYDIPQIKEVSVEGPNAHLVAGDVIKSVDGHKIDYVSGETLNVVLQNTDKTQMPMVIIRNGEEITTTLYRQLKMDENNQTFTLGLSIGAYQHTFAQALSRCVPLTLAFGWNILEFLGLLLTGAVALSSVAGPITTITTIASFSQQTIANLFVFLPFISVNLAIFNLLPIPALDGSKIVFTTIEWIRGKPINRKLENTIHTCGLVALLALVILVDISHLFL